MKNLFFLFPLGLMACGGSSETIATEINDTTSVSTDTVQSIDHSGTYEYIYPYNSLDLIENHYIVLEKNTDNTYSGRYYGQPIYLMKHVKDIYQDFLFCQCRTF
jgi:hypothetical protein